MDKLVKTSNSTPTKLSQALARIFHFLSFAVIGFAVIFWTFADLKAMTLFGIPNSLFNNFHPPILGDATANMRFLGFITYLPMILCWSYICYQLSHLFSAFGQGQIFTISNIQHIKRAARTLFITFFLSIVTESLLSVVLTMNNPIGQRELTIAVGTPHLFMLITALVIIVAAYVMEEGLKLEEEKKLTI